MYGGLAQSELLYVGRLTYLPDEESVEETIVTTRQTADLVEESENPDVDDVPDEDTEPSKRMKSASYFVLWVLVLDFQFWRLELYGNVLSTRKGVKPKKITKIKNKFNKIKRKTLTRCSEKGLHEKSALHYSLFRYNSFIKGAM